ncbi:MAG: o-succinylbenzoate--CoA ligase [Frankiales bacterium]|nr:o-succinylbenzoate--CoA ligase [Frankiales bacterium]
MSDVQAREEIIAKLTAPDGAFPVGSAEVRGVKLRVYETAPDTLRDVFLSGAKWGKRPAITYEDESYTWDEYLHVVKRFAKILTDRYGVKKGDRVALAMRNFPEWIFTFQAAVSIGAVCVPLNAWWSATELQFALADCEAKIFVGDRERVERVQSKRSELPSIESVIEVRPGETVLGDNEWQQLLAGETEELDLASIPIDTDDDCTIMYTSGTTGQPKGAVATHRAHTSNLFNMLAQGAIEGEMATWRGDPPPPPAPEVPVTMLPGPLFHIAGLPMVYLAPVGGLHIVLMYKWDADRAVELIEREQVNSFGGVPTVVRQLMDAAEKAGTTLSSLRTLGTGGAQSSTALIGRIDSQFGSRVGTGTGYGLTETTGPMVGIGSHDYFERPLAVGRPYPTSEVRVVDENGNDVPQGEMGESWFKGPNISRGYWNRVSDAFMEDGWFRSGDLVKQDEDGFVYIVDRLKDIVIKAGENVYCSEVEDVLFNHPAVQELSVFGAPHELWGEEVVSVVQVKPGQSVTAEELREYAKDKLASFKIPTTFLIGDEPLPRNAAGKVLKRELRQTHIDNAKAAAH